MLIMFCKNVWKHWNVPSDPMFDSLVRKPRLEPPMRQAIYFAADCFPETDALSLQKLTCWLEDVHIRRRPIPKRKPLRLPSFPDALPLYLKELEPDIGSISTDASVPFSVSLLVDFALQLSFEDGATEYNVPHDPWEGRSIPVIVGAAADADVLEIVQQLLREVDVDPGALTSEDGLKILAAFAEERLAPADQGESRSSAELASLPLGFSTADSELDRLAKVLRVLHVRELRKLQNRINAAIAAMQEVTANPKTDSKLGKVGR